MQLVGYLYEDYLDDRSLEHKVRSSVFPFSFQCPPLLNIIQ